MDGKTFIYRYLAAKIASCFAGLPPANPRGSLEYRGLRRGEVPKRIVEATDPPSRHTLGALRRALQWGKHRVASHHALAG